MLLPRTYRSRRSLLTAFSAYRKIPIVALRRVLNLIQCHVLSSIQYRLRAVSYSRIGSESILNQTQHVARSDDGDLSVSRERWG